ncbi:hypothetical protein [Mycoplasma mycoides]|uniref:hypothetical protein n=1 Tax=Mycoplasma mycoides TaxID=2102 RepID=UPI001F213913|nr:hypothetical protein [Mycoplasma mycoides]
MKIKKIAPFAILFSNCTAILASDKSYISLLLIIKAVSKALIEAKSQHNPLLSWSWWNKR